MIPIPLHTQKVMLVIPNLDYRALLLTTGIFREVAIKTAEKKSNAKEVGTRFEMREVTFRACYIRFNKKRERKNQAMENSGWAISGGSVEAQI